MRRRARKSSGFRARLRLAIRALRRVTLSVCLEQVERGVGEIGEGRTVPAEEARRELRLRLTGWGSQNERRNQLVNLIDVDVRMAAGEHRALISAASDASSMKRREVRNHESICGKRGRSEAGSDVNQCG